MSLSIQADWPYREQTFFPYAAQQGKGVISKNSAPCRCSVPIRLEARHFPTLKNSSRSTE